MTIDSKHIRINHRIKVAQIRLIGSDGRQIGVVPVKEGLRLAQEEGLDLVEISPATNPPVCKVLDFGKYLYDLKKKEKETRKHQKVINLKEVKMSSKIEEHDYQTKLRNARRFVERGDKVKLTMFFRGREVTHVDIGLRIINRFIQDLSDVGEVERNAGLEGKMIQVYFAPSTGPKKPAVTPAGNSEKEENDAKGKDKQSS